MHPVKRHKYGLNLYLSTTLTAVTVLTSAAAHALPQGAQLVGGAASIVQDASRVTVQQSTQRAVINWHSFDIAAGEQVIFQQPSSSSVTLNRVTGGMGASQILGNITANGTVMLVNPNGVFIGPSAHINVGSMVATTADTTTDRFMAGDDRFDIAGRPDAAIINQGAITAADAGLVALVAPNVINEGYIQARLGKVQLASGDTFALDLYGDGLVSLEASEAVKSQLVSNSGVISASGGQVIMTSAAASEVVNSVINMDGIIEATSVAEHNGEIIIFAEGSNAVRKNNSGSKGKKKGSSTVLVSGVLDASGRKSGESGGKITVTGDNVALLNGAIIDATGHTGAAGTTVGKPVSAYREGSAGGDIRIGGDYLGQGDTPTAMNLYVDSGALILNDSLYSGDAGRSIFWSDGATQFYGNVYARALGGLSADMLTWNAAQGGNAGDGGFVETSGHQYLDAQGYVDLTASNGRKGTYFLDPNDITIYGNVDPAFVSTDGTSINLAANLKLWLDAGDTSKVTLTYSTNGLSSATATGTSGTNTITTSVDVSSNLAVGARIRLGSAGSVTTADTVGSDTYTITAISGTSITLSSNLIANYTGSDLYRGLVSQWNDKSGNAHHVSQATFAEMPLYVGASSQLLFSGNQYLVGSGPNLSGELTSFVVANPTSVTSGTQQLWSQASAGDRQHYTMEFGRTSGRQGVLWGDQIINTGSTALSGGTNYLFGADRIGVTGSWTSHLYLNGTGDNTAASAFNPNSNDLTFTVGGLKNSNAAGDFVQRFSGRMQGITIYDTGLSTAARQLVDQYNSARSSIALTPPGTGATEVARATAADGYSVFTTRYLERLSQSADISLQATNSITLDLKGDTLSLTADRSLTLATTNGNITSASAGAINTSRTTTGGNITMTSGGAGTINVSNIALTASGGGIITLNGVVQGATSGSNVPASDVARMFQTLSPQDNFSLSVGESSQNFSGNGNESEPDSRTGSQQAGATDNTTAKVVLPDSVSPEILIDPELQRFLGLPKEL